MSLRSLIGPVALLAATGCATTAPEHLASVPPQECKVVAVYSASDVLRNQNARGVPGSEIARSHLVIRLQEQHYREQTIGAHGGQPPQTTTGDFISQI